MAYLKAELSNRSKYHISKHRYYELKHFCMQYKEWKDMYYRLSEFPDHYGKLYSGYAQNADPTDRVATMRVELDRNIKMIEHCAQNADPDIGKFILKAVTEGIAFPTLQTVYDIPCGKDMYYDRYRKFYWLLSQEKGLS